MKTTNNPAVQSIKVTDAVLTAGNVLSFSRILILPFIIWEHQQAGGQPTTLLAILVGYIILSDFLDGWLSRMLNQVSETGKWLDPLADKLCAVVLFVYVWWIGLIPTWFMGLIILRDVAILVGSLIVRQKRGKLAMSVMTGKIAVNFLALYWIFIVFLPTYTTTILILKYSSVVMLLLSGMVYAIRGYKILNKGIEFN